MPHAELADATSYPTSYPTSFDAERADAAFANTYPVAQPAPATAAPTGPVPHELARLRTAAFDRAMAAHQAGDYAHVLRQTELADRDGHLSADLLNLAGVAAKRCCDKLRSEALYRQALARAPRHGATLNNLAILLHELDRPDEALHCYEQAIALAPDDVLPHLNLGNLHLAAKRYPQAQAEYQRVLSLRPQLPEAWRALAEVHAGQQDRAQARECLNRALQTRADYTEALQRLGDLWREDADLLQAQRCYERLISASAPGRPLAVAYNRLGEVLQAQGQKMAAEDAYQQALHADPDHADALNNLGIVLHERKQYAPAEQAYRRALAIQPDYAEVWNNLAVLVQKLKRFDEAETCYQRALALQPDYAAARCNYGLLCLTQGRFDEGWPLYEARYAPGRTVAIPKMSKPQWQGEPLTGKSILIWSEQGLGDEIQFARYAKILKDQGAAHVGLVCKKPLVRLFKGLGGVDTLHEEETRFSIGRYDYWTFPLSIPRYLCPTPAHIPAAPSYLRAEPALQAQWRDRLGGKPASGGTSAGSLAGASIGSEPAHRPHRIGLVWRGRAEYSNDANRSIPDLRMLAPLWRWPQLQFVSLQKGEGEREAQLPPAGQPMLPLGQDLRCFADTAAIVTQLDLVITVDTGIAHLCGALGVPCWVMLPFVGTDWRWFLHRSDTPWYPSLRLFRQPAPDAWQPVIDAMTTALVAQFKLPDGDDADAIAQLVDKLRQLSLQDRALVQDLVSRLQSSHAADTARA